MGKNLFETYEVNGRQYTDNLGDIMISISKKQYIEYEQQKEEIERLNNILDELEKDFEWQLKKQIDIDKFAEEQGFLNYNPVKIIVEHFKNKLQELKDSDE